jgi:hypothetical protein
MGNTPAQRTAVSLHWCLSICRQLHLGRHADTGLKELARLKRLQTLYLAFTKVTDTGLMELGAMPRLKYLSLYHAERITDQGIANLRKALPKCEIRRD